MYEIFSKFVFFKDKLFNINILNKLAEDPELTKTLNFTPSHLDHFFSNSITLNKHESNSLQVTKVYKT